MLKELQHSIRRYTSLKTHKITALPVAILMPHSGCNCRCVMCDIWKGNANRKQLTEKDIQQLLESFRQLGTRQVVMSGGEALLNPLFFRFCEMIAAAGIKITLLSTGILLKKYAAEIINAVDDVIVSLDGDEHTHDAIRNIEGAYQKLKEGVAALRSYDAKFRVTGRSVIQKLNYRNWERIVDSAQELGLNSISFLPADVSSQAFNREMPWDEQHVSNVAIPENELDELQKVINSLTGYYQPEFESGYIVESPAKIQAIHTYYAAIYGHNKFPVKRCNAPWVSAVIEADGEVKPCFFHNSIGNIRKNFLTDVLNGAEGFKFRSELDISNNSICRRCVCSLNLPFYKNPS